jgi:hypothetical protein
MRTKQTIKETCPACPYRTTCPFETYDLSVKSVSCPFLRNRNNAIESILKPDVIPPALRNEIDKILDDGDPTWQN